MCNATCGDLMLTTQLGNVLRGRLTFHRRVSGEDHLTDITALQAIIQRIEANIARTNTIQR
ncbi:Uncharacterised protein [Vibrio cholerae]|uniref:Uncharacterized protein n=1 Tax=Vibrio cholerae TaxID=666 RepID=A0A655UGR2_VIBCL|nr:Uncharacterised protein [Vibrio cholerae]